MTKRVVLHDSVQTGGKGQNPYFPFGFVERQWNVEDDVYRGTNLEPASWGRYLASHVTQWWRKAAVLFIR